MNLHALIPLAALILNQFIWVYIFAKNRTMPVNRAFLLFCGALSMWLGLEFLSWIEISDSMQGPLQKIMAIAWLSVGFLYINFIYAVLEKKRDALYFAMLALPIISIVLNFTTNLITDGYVKYYWGVTSVRGAYYTSAVLLVIILPIVYAIALLFRKIAATAEKNRMLRLIFGGTVLGTAIQASVGFHTDVILPEGSLSLASISCFLLCVFIFFTIQKYGLMLIDLQSAAYDLFQNITDGILIIDPEGQIILSNKAAKSILDDHMIEKKDATKVLQQHNMFEKTDASKVFRKYEYQKNYDDFETTVNSDERKIVSFSQSPVHQGNREIGKILIFRDLTKRQQLEAEIQKRQRIESIGVLAGGIAHDFNNILTGIMTNVGLAKFNHQEGDEELVLLTEAENAAFQAKHLTQQLLTFSKGGEPIRKAVSVPELIERSVQFSLSGSNVKSNYNFSSDLWEIFGDRGQLGQMLNNLAVNSVQSMPKGGEIDIEVRNSILANDNTLLIDAGKYVEIKMIDRGTGIPADIVPRIFDPYFSTKETGSGLGLASAYSIVRRHQGYIGVDSIEGKGSTFTICLPVIDREAPVSLPPSKADMAHRGRILVMDDDELIVRAATKVLTVYGFDCMTVRDGQSALEAFEQAKTNGEPFDVVVMDLTIQGGMGGQQAIAKLLEMDPKAKAIVSSGYSNDPVMANYKEYGFKAVVAKPYVVGEFTDVVTKVMQADWDSSEFS
ncbi:MAG: response regulator [Proteobacteria bacterium]|nr:response regulator [Pseudomonadota bacterium]